MVAAAIVAVGCTSTNPAYDSTSTAGSNTITTSGSTSASSDVTVSSSGPVETFGESMTDSASNTNGSGSTSSSPSGSSSGSPLDGSEVGSSTGPEPLACDRALWVTGDTMVAANGDTPFHGRLLDLGFTVTVVENAASQPGDVGENCLVVLSPLGAATDVEDKFRDTPVPLITWEYNLYDNLRMVDPFGMGWGINDPLDTIEIADPTHPLAAGLEGVVPVYSGGGRISWGVPVGDVQIVATAFEDPSRATIFAFEAGAMMAAGFVAPARRVALGGGQTLAPVTEPAVALFEAAVRWSVE